VSARSCLLVLGLLLLLPTASARADEGVLKDPAGDALPAWDMTRVVADNGPLKLRIEIHYKGRLRPQHGLGLYARVDIDMGTPGESTYDQDFSLQMLRGSPESPDLVELVRREEGGYDEHTVRCDGLRLRTLYGRGLLEFVVPQYCFGALVGRLRLTALTYMPRGPSDKADYIRHWGPWVEKG